ncbi:hypothetical protein AVEN_226094-1 [Araneus ventricosus]|uniref:Uncharacterized protein n=1 Tax=Araneus ventricosus TaxID=182803 RepID=A0A4Y2J9Y8_ARAVE|nr:hypothetical protein AVEN_226094-1 [Araneus ventricosus]
MHSNSAVGRTGDVSAQLPHEPAGTGGRPSEGGGNAPHHGSRVLPQCRPPVHFWRRGARLFLYGSGGLFDGFIPAHPSTEAYNLQHSKLIAEKIFNFKSKIQDVTKEYQK